MLKLERVLVPTDFSDCGRKALEYGCAFAARFDSELHLLHVVHDNVWVASEAGMLGPPAIEQFVADARTAATESLQELPGADWDVAVRSFARRERAWPSLRSPAMRGIWMST